MRMIKITNRETLIAKNVSNITFGLTGREHIVTLCVTITLNADNNAGGDISFTIDLLTKRQVLDKFGTAVWNTENIRGLVKTEGYDDLLSKYDISTIEARVNKIVRGEEVMNKNQSVRSYLELLLKNDKDMLKCIKAMAKLRNSCLRLVSKEEFDKMKYANKKKHLIEECSSQEELDKLNKFLSKNNDKIIKDMDTLEKIKKGDDIESEKEEPVKEEITETKQEEAIDNNVKKSVVKWDDIYTNIVHDPTDTNKIPFGWIIFVIAIVVIATMFAVTTFIM